MAQPAVSTRSVTGRRTEKIAETVARQILRDIQQQGLEPGAMLPSESAMLERFDIGRGSLREALRILEVNGLVTIKTGPGGGPIVAGHDPRKAAEQPGEEAGAMVRAAMEASSQPPRDDARYASLSTSFHATICSAAGNPVLALAANSIQSIWSVRVTSVLFSPEDRPLVFQQHEAITRAIEKHEAKRAERLMRAHMEHYRQYCEARYPARMDDVVDWS